MTDPVQIEEHMREGEARIELAFHYRIPYPRPVRSFFCLFFFSFGPYHFKVNLPTYSLPPSHNRIRFRSEYEIEEMSRPIYLKSYEVKEEVPAEQETNGRPPRDKE